VLCERVGLFSLLLTEKEKAGVWLLGDDPNSSAQSREMRDAS
jgi:hypothetical protein